MQEEREFNLSKKDYIPTTKLSRGKKIKHPILIPIPETKQQGCPKFYFFLLSLGIFFIYPYFNSFLSDGSMNNMSHSKDADNDLCNNQKP